jgi:hypothetical protein
LANEKEIPALVVDELEVPRFVLCDVRDDNGGRRRVRGDDYLGQEPDVAWVDIVTLRKGKYVVT